MNDKHLLCCFFTLLLVAPVNADSNSNNNYKAPRTEFGHPELRGVWNFSSNTPLERPEEFGNREFLTEEEVAVIHASAVERTQDGGDAFSNSGVGTYNQFWIENIAQGENFRTSLIIDPPNGRLPPLVAGVTPRNGGLGPDLAGERPVRFRVGGIGKDGPEDRGLSERCIMGFNSGPPFLPSGYNNNVQLFQTKNHVVIMTEMIHDARIVPLEDKPPMDAGLKQWSGNSRGHWEGETLVVETTNFTDKIQSFRNVGKGTDLHLVERFTRVGPDTIEYQFTVTDLTNFTAPITVLVPMARADGDIYEYACHEGNYGMFNTLSGERALEKSQ